ncbi:cytochrome c oxidase accessory protein CcoG [Lacimicrobium alkaliphilum]|nr:cytochrome c oxidase accessory protein CcoG [Lacimicrobium alkaliphilum]
MQGKPIQIRNITPGGAVEIHPTSRKKIYIRSVMGKIERLRRGTGLLFLSVFLLLPWLSYAGQQAILLDFTAQRFHLFGMTMWPQDLTLLAWLFIVSAFALFFVTALWGRVWCGFMCPQTVFTFLFVWIEEKVEGARNKRIHLDHQPFSLQKVLKKSVKHSLWLVIATITALTFVGYFTPIKTLVADFATFELGFWPLFFIVFFTLCTYGNAGWMRETMCTHMCPYSRFQSSMFDNDTVTVTYDRARGESRGPRPKKLSAEQVKTMGLGDCIDCNLCVQVCPTGIDIRNGLQYECINCGACVDACNGVMAKMGYEPGLISFTSANALKGKAAALLRPKVIGYFIVLLCMIAALSFELITKKPLDIDVVRDRANLYRETLNGSIENVYTLVIMNKEQHAQKVSISTEGLPKPVFHGKLSLTIEGGQMVRHPITIELDSQSIEQAVTPFSIIVTNESGDAVNSDSTFIFR